MRCNADKNRAGFDGQGYKSINQLIKDAYGVSAKQIRQQMEWAEMKAQSESFLEEASIPESSEREFSTILAKMAARGITPRLLADFDQESQLAMGQENYLDREILPHQADTEADCGVGSGRSAVKGVIESAEKFLKKPLRVAGAVAACVVVAAVVIFAPKIDAIAKKKYQYEARVESGERGRIVWNNQEDYTSETDDLENAYIQIREKLEISVLKLNYVPEGMLLSNLTIQNGYAKMSFTYEGNYIYMLEVTYPISDSSIHCSDCEEYDSVFNEWIGQEIPILRNKISKKDYEYNAYFSINDSRYILAGVMQEEEFLNIVENLVVDK